MDAKDNEQTELLRLIWNEMKAVKSSVDTKVEAVRSEVASVRSEVASLHSEVEANRLAIEKLDGRFDELKETFDALRHYMAEAEIRSATMIVELRKNHQLYADLRSRVERLEEHAGFAH